MYLWDLLRQLPSIISIEPAGERVQVRPQTGDGQPARLDLVELNSVPVFWIRIHLIRIRIQHFGLNTDPDSDPDPWFWWKKIYKKLTGEKSNFFWIKTTIYLSLGFQKGRPSYRILQPSKENAQHLKTWNLLFFSTFVGHFCLPGSGYGSIDLIEYVRDPDSKHCTVHNIW